jgi:hypothetical protein
VAKKAVLDPAARLSSLAASVTVPPTVGAVMIHQSHELDIYSSAYQGKVL